MRRQGATGPASWNIDVLLEALGHAAPGEVLVIDNGGRRDEACIGDLVVLEAEKADIAGIVIGGFTATVWN